MYTEADTLATRTCRFHPARLGADGRYMCCGYYSQLAWTRLNRVHAGALVESHDDVGCHAVDHVDSRAGEPGDDEVAAWTECPVYAVPQRVAGRLRAFRGVDVARDVPRFAERDPEGRRGAGPHGTLLFRVDAADDVPPADARITVWRPFGERCEVDVGSLQRELWTALQCDVQRLRVAGGEDADDVAEDMDVRAFEGYYHGNHVGLAYAAFCLADVVNAADRWAAFEPFVVVARMGDDYVREKRL